MDRISTLHNPIDKREIFRGILGGSLTFIACLAIFSITDDINTLRLLLSVIGGLLVLWFMGFWGEFWTRPRSITITAEGVLMQFFPWRKRKFLIWADILSVYVSPENPKNSDYKIGRDGFLWSKKKKSYPLYWPIAQYVREAYKENCGKYPPITWSTPIK